MSKALSYIVAARRSEIDELENLSRTCELVLAVGEFVHCLQQERGSSNLFLASSGTRFAQLRQERVLASDAALSAVNVWLDRFEEKGAQHSEARLLTRIAMALHAIDKLTLIRAEIDTLACPPGIATERFNKLIGTLLSLVFESADVAVDPAISRLLIAFFHLMQGKEFAGQERAKGILMAGQGLNEEAAYRLLRQNAMNRNCRIADIAETITSMTDILPTKK